MAASPETSARLASVRTDGSRPPSKCLHLSHCNLSDSLPPVLWSLTALIRLDLGFNNIRKLDARIGRLTSVQSLFLNDNPLYVVPEALSLCIMLKTLDLRNTLIQNLPRELGRLTSLVDLNLDGAPLKQSLEQHYGKGRQGLFAYLQRKDDRRVLKGQFVCLMRETVYPFTPTDQLNALTNEVFDQLKDFTSIELKKLLRNAQRILPSKIEQVDPAAIRSALAHLCEEERQRHETSNLQLQLKAIYPEPSLDAVAGAASALRQAFPDPAERRRVVRLHALLFPEAFEQFSADTIRRQYEHLKQERLEMSLTKRLKAFYQDASDNEVSLLLRSLMKSAQGDNDKLNRSALQTNTFYIRDTPGGENQTDQKESHEQEQDNDNDNEEQAEE
ncbi:unnamed protein product [Vitrella brassicaformis CCMP3155]|uniref:U2A'/phosphoprotein 32 family A C-terminal domain-containing protein n=1 Tax=Vitrella brassicaformis (strain CCMP3155) TaxID=1169540 RepID=A0A0G4EBD1_VITBC|nr:unnamed protein product [Vitrella brassicaformis CCMP3155]|eukprot:CEL92581.1 unnamed protein product [Vitrella brassicaformis CCMP3155]